jgi:hypothetical protein
VNVSSARSSSTWGNAQPQFEDLNVVWKHYPFKIMRLQFTAISNIRRSLQDGSFGPTCINPALWANLRGMSHPEIPSHHFRRYGVAGIACCKDLNLTSASHFAIQFSNPILKLLQASL